MARDVYYQSVGNPLQLDRLPQANWPDLQLPYQPQADDAARQSGRLLFLLGALAVAAMLAQWMQLSGRSSPSTFSWVWANLLLLIIAGFVTGRAIKEQDARWLGWPLGGLVTAFCFLNTPIPLAWHIFLVSGALSGLAWGLATHWTMLATASPLDASLARKLRENWQGYLIPLTLASAGMPWLLKWLSPGIVVCLLLAISLLQIMETARRNPDRPIWRTAKRALVSWLTYNRRDVVVPGLFISPCGRWIERIAFTGGCVFLLATLAVRLPVEMMQQSVHQEAKPGTASWLEPIFSIRRVTGPEDLILWLGGILLTTAILIAVVFWLPVILTLPVLVEAERYRKPHISAKNWSRVVQGREASLDPIERESLYLGQVAADGSPLLVPRSVFAEHAHFLGDSGSGKTSLGLAPFLEQVIPRGDCSVIVLDLKADSMELLATLKAAGKEARRRTGRPFPLKHFSNQPGRSTFAFNPLLQSYWRDLDLYMRTDIQCGALGLMYGPDYGEGYYSSANAAVLYHTMKTFPEAVTYRELAERVGYVVANANRQELHPEIRKAGVHVQEVLRRLGSFEALNVTSQSEVSPAVWEQAINFEEVFNEPQLHYFHLSSTLSPGSSPEIARLVTYSLLAAATQVSRRHQVYLVIDEFQRMVARNLEYMLQLARSMGVGIILANQSMQDLKTSKADLIPPIESNCRFRQWFAVSSRDDCRRLIESSGETVDLDIGRTHSQGPNGNSTSVTRQEKIRSRLSLNDILLASDHPRQSLVRISRGAGYAQYGGLPFVVESDYHISETTYRERKTMPWPDQVPGSFLAKKSEDTQTSNSPTPPPGPIITTETIRAGETINQQVSDLFDSFLQSAPPNDPHAKTRTRK